MKATELSSLPYPACQECGGAIVKTTDPLYDLWANQKVYQICICIHPVRTPDVSGNQTLLED